MKSKILSFIAIMGLTNSLYAFNETYFNPWTITGVIGLSYYSNTTSNDNLATIGRFSIGHALFTKPYWQTDIEVGIQSGSTLRLNLPEESID